MKVSKFIVLSAAAFVLSSCEHRKADDTEPEVQPVAQSAQEIQPLLVGAKVPELSLKTVEDQLLDLNAVIAEKPSVLVFYRGGWCMYCNTQLGQLVQVQQQIKDLGFQIIGISPDKSSHPSHFCTPFSVKPFCLTARFKSSG
jgi:thiol-disulfide isomerase/thioredoxin